MQNKERTKIREGPWLQRFDRSQWPYCTTTNTTSPRGDGWFKGIVMLPPLLPSNSCSLQPSIGRGLPLSVYPYPWTWTESRGSSAGPYSVLFRGPKLVQIGGIWAQKYVGRIIFEYCTFPNERSPKTNRKTTPKMESQSDPQFGTILFKQYIMMTVVSEMGPILGAVFWLVLGRYQEHTKTKVKIKISWGVRCVMPFSSRKTHNTPNEKYLTNVIFLYWCAVRAAQRFGGPRVRERAVLLPPFPCKSDFRAGCRAGLTDARAPLLPLCGLNTTSATIACTTTNNKLIRIWY